MLLGCRVMSSMMYAFNKQNNVSIISSTQFDVGNTDIVKVETARCFTVIYTLCPQKMTA